jgi:hypothetical protein
VQFNLGSDGVETQRFDGNCEYEKHGDVWFPSKWTHSLYRGTLVRYNHAESKIVKLVINPELTDKDFPLDIPLGTFVQDQRPTSPAADRAGYVLMPEGKRRVKTQGDIIAAVEELKKRKQDEPKPADPPAPAGNPAAPKPSPNKDDFEQ